MNMTMAPRFLSLRIQILTISEAETIYFAMPLQSQFSTKKKNADFMNH